MDNSPLSKMIDGFAAEDWTFWVGQLIIWSVFAAFLIWRKRRKVAAMSRHEKVSGAPWNQ